VRPVEQSLRVGPRDGIDDPFERAPEPANRPSVAGSTGWPSGARARMVARSESSSQNSGHSMRPTSVRANAPGAGVMVAGSHPSVHLRGAT